ncbi:20962_t:CDS:2, partial [Gigaspora rosea]
QDRPASVRCATVGSVRCRRLFDVVRIHCAGSDVCFVRTYEQKLLQVNLFETSQDVYDFENEQNSDDEWNLRM